METVNLDEIRKKVLVKLKNTGWDIKLSHFFNTKLQDVLEYLLNEAQDGRRFVPKVAQMLRAFETCHFSKVRVVIMGQSPYPYIGVPDGLAFSCSQKGHRLEKALSLIFEQINNTVYNGKILCSNGDLTRWSEQGVLLLNVALTTTTKNPESHILKWKPLIAEVLDAIIFNHPDTIFIFMGKHAAEWYDTIPDSFLKIKTDHPSYAAYMKTKWDSKDCFVKANKHLESLGKTPILW